MKITPKGLLLLLSLFSVFYAMGCSNDPVMSELVNSRMSVVLKGTYLSNGVETRQTSLNAYKYSSGMSNAASSKADSEPFKLYLDIAELRLGSGSGPGSNPNDYWEYFTNERVVMSDGEDDLNNFLTGKGVSMGATDVEAKTYNHLALYFRRFATSPSFNYDSSGNSLGQRKTTFDNETIYGVNAGAFYYYAPTDDSDDTPRLFPLENKNLSLTIPDNEDDYVLEVRVVINKTLMKHLYSGSSSSSYVSFIGPSDWLRNKYDKSGKLGGNFAITARIYQPGNTGRISGNSSTIYAVMPAGTTFDAKTTLPIAAAKGTITNLEPGSYDVYKITLGNNGLPSSSPSKCSTVTVTAGNITANGC